MVTFFLKKKNRVFYINIVQSKIYVHETTVVVVGYCL